MSILLHTHRRLLLSMPPTPRRMLLRHGQPPSPTAIAVLVYCSFFETYGLSSVVTPTPSSAHIRAYASTTPSNSPTIIPLSSLSASETETLLTSHSDSISTHATRSTSSRDERERYVVDARTPTSRVGDLPHAVPQRLSLVYCSSVSVAYGCR
jgi:hypothetical protein